MRAMPTTSESGGQFGEDRFLETIFDGRSDGYCVEVGAYDGVTSSATLPFELRGWQCLLIEPIPALVEEIRRHRDCLIVNCAASSAEGEATFYVADTVEQMSTLALTPGHLDWIREVGGDVHEITVRTATLDRLLGEAGFPTVDFVTIDVEGHELAVLEGFSLETWQPRIVILEDNSIDGDPQLVRHMARHGYVHFRRTGVNEWFAHESDTDLVRPSELRRLERTKAWHRFERPITRTRKRIAHRIAVRAGEHLPVGVKGPLRKLYDLARPSRFRR